MTSPEAPLAPRPRVCYALSPALILASNALPSNVGRSQMVHSLVYHFGLLDLPSASELLERPDAGLEGDDEDPLALVKLLAGGDHGNQSGVDSLSTVEDGQDGYGKKSEEAMARSADARLARAEVITPELATEQALKAFHSGTYVEGLLAGKDERKALDDEVYGLVDDCYRFLELADHVRLIAGASITAAKCLADDTADIVINWDGGRHHAHKSRAAGFCYVNDIVLAILELRKPRKRVIEEDKEPPESPETAGSASASPLAATSLGFGARPEDIIRAHDKSSTNGRKRENKTVPQANKKRRTVLKRLERILYIDLDLHWGDGVEEAFRGSSSVLTLSIHNQAPGFYPAAPDVLSDTIDYQDEKETKAARSNAHSLQVPLKPDAGPETWARVWSSCVMPVLEAYEPEAIVVQCGLDGLAGDPMKQWNLDLKSLLLSVQQVLRYTREHPGVKMLLLGGGGYNSPNAARGWTAITALALGRLKIHSGDVQDNTEADTEVKRQGEFNIETADAEQQFDRNDGGSAQQQSQSAHVRRTCSTLCRGNEAHLLTLQSAIPDTSPDWPLYGAAATLNVVGGDRLDLLNDEEYLSKVEQYFARMVRALESDKMDRHEKSEKHVPR